MYKTTLFRGNGRSSVCFSGFCLEEINWSHAVIEECVQLQPVNHGKI